MCLLYLKLTTELLCLCIFYLAYILFKSSFACDAVDYVRVFTAKVVLPWVLFAHDTVSKCGALQYQATEEALIVDEHSFLCFLYVTHSN